MDTRPRRLGFKTAARWFSAIGGIVAFVALFAENIDTVRENIRNWTGYGDAIPVADLSLRDLRAWFSSVPDNKVIMDGVIDNRNAGIAKRCDIELQTKTLNPANEDALVSMLSEREIGDISSTVRSKSFVTIFPVVVFGDGITRVEPYDGRARIFCDNMVSPFENVPLDFKVPGYFTIWD